MDEQKNVDRLLISAHVCTEVAAGRMTIPQGQAVLADAGIKAPFRWGNVGWAVLALLGAFCLGSIIGDFFR